MQTKLTKAQHADAGPTGLSTDTVTPAAWQCTSLQVTGNVCWLVEWVVCCCYPPPPPFPPPPPTILLLLSCMVNLPPDVRHYLLGSSPVCLFACLTSQQHASVSQGRICSDNFTCCHAEIEVANQTFHLTQSQYTDTGSTSPSADPITPGAWQGSHWSANF